MTAGGPGQGGVLYEQGLHLRPDFEAVLTPVVDFALTRPEVDGKRLALLGRSFGGYLALLDYTLEDRAGDITCPTLVTEGEGDFAGGQSRLLYEQLACPKAYRTFTQAEGASGHMEGLGQQVWDGHVFDWLDATLAR